MSQTTLAQKTAKQAGRALVLLAGVAAWLSYASVRAGAIPVFGRIEGSAFPLLLDVGVFVSSEYYLATVRGNRPQHGFRALTHALIGVTIALNVSVSHDWIAVIFHAVPPAVFAALVELKARKELGDARARSGRPDRIPLRLWLTSPIDSAKLSLWIARGSSYSAERANREAFLTARRALRIAVPGWHGKPRLARGLVRRQLRAGTLDPRALVTATGLDRKVLEPGPEAVLRVALRAALGAPEAPVEPVAAVIYPPASRTVLPSFAPFARPFGAQANPFAPTVNTLPDSAPVDPVEQARQMRRDGDSFGQIAKQLGRSKTWAYDAVNGSV